MKNFSQKAGRRPRMDRRGFTLLEVLLVLAILIAIAAMVVPNIVGRSDEANKDLTRINIAAFEKAAQMYKIDNKDFFAWNNDEHIAVNGMGYSNYGSWSRNGVTVS